MYFTGDYHIHSVYSDGRGTPEEMVWAALNAGLAEIGLTDHGPGNIGTGVKNSQTFLDIKAELSGLQEKYADIKLYTGAEADVLSPSGTLDISKEVIDQLDYLLVGLHPYVLPRDISGAGWILGNLATATRFSGLKRRIRNQNTKALVESIYNYDVYAVTHPGLKMEIDIAEVAKACRARSTAWEINTGHKFPSYLGVLEAFRCGVDFIVNSDAHFPETVGCFEYASWVLEKAGVPPERVKNAVIDRRE